MTSVDQKIVLSRCKCKLTLHGFECVEKDTNAVWKVLMQDQLIRAVVPPDGKPFSNARRIDDQCIVFSREPKYYASECERLTMTVKEDFEYITFSSPVMEKNPVVCKITKFIDMDYMTEIQNSCQEHFKDYLNSKTTESFQKYREFETMRDFWMGNWL